MPDDSGEDPCDGPARGLTREAVPNGLFAFEADLLPSLQCIPMGVRYKLDAVGWKVPLRTWNRLPAEQRTALLAGWPVDTPADRDRLRDTLAVWLRDATNEPLKPVTLPACPPWDVPDAVAEHVAAVAAGNGLAISADEWRGLTALQRFALVKLAASEHERGRFAEALAEFRGGR